MANLLQHFAVVGVLERFDEFLILLKRFFGWKTPLYSKQNVTRARPPREVIDEGAIDAIKECCKYDIKLYGFACNRMDELLALEGKNFIEEVKSFKALNSGMLPADG